MLLLFSVGILAQMNKPIRLSPLSTSQVDVALLRLDQVLAMVSLGKTYLYALIAEEKFPKAIKLGERCARWHIDDVRDWIEEKRVRGKDS